MSILISPQEFLLLLLATVSAVYLGFSFSRGHQKSSSVPFVVILALILGYVGWQVSHDSNARFESPETQGGQTEENPDNPDDIPADNLINTIVTKPPSVPKDLTPASPDDIESDIFVNTIATKPLSVPPGFNFDNPDDIPSDNLINTGDLGSFLRSVSIEGRLQVLRDASLWAESWTSNIPYLKFGDNDVLFLLNQLPDPLPFEQVDALVANAVLTSKNQE